MAALGGEAQQLRVALHKERHRTAALLDRVAEMSRDLRRRDAQLAAALRRAESAEQTAVDGDSPRVVASPVPAADEVCEADSPQHLLASVPLGVEALRSRTGRAKGMFLDIQSPHATSSVGLSDERAGEPDSPEPCLVEVVVPEFSADSRLVTVLLPDGSEVLVELPETCVAGDRHVIDVTQAARQQRRRLFVEGEGLATDCTREQLLEEIAELRSKLAATEDQQPPSLS
jgi:hypothetical protein